MRAITQKFLHYSTNIPKPSLPKKTKQVPLFIRNTMSGSDESPAFNTPRLVAKKVLAKLQHEGDGAVVRRGIGRSNFLNGIFFSFLFLFLFFFPFLFYSDQIWVLGGFFFSLPCYSWVVHKFLFFRSDLRNLDPFLMLDDFSGK